MTGWMLFVIFVALVGSMFSGRGEAEPPPFEDTDFGATFASRRQLKKARLLRRKLNV